MCWKCAVRKRYACFTFSPEAFALNMLNTLRCRLRRLRFNLQFFHLVFLQLFCDFDYWSLKVGDYHCSCDLSSTGNERKTFLIYFKSNLETFLKDLNKFSLVLNFLTSILRFLSQFLFYFLAIK